MATLKTNYKDDILDTSVNTQRKYRMVNNADGTISLEDVTVYTQNGDSFGAADINKTNQAVLDLNSSLSRYNEETDSLDIYQNDTVIGSIFCGFQFDGRYYSAPNNYKNFVQNSAFRKSNGSINSGYSVTFATSGIEILSPQNGYFQSEGIVSDNVNLSAFSTITVNITSVTHGNQGYAVAIGNKDDIVSVASGFASTSVYKENTVIGTNVSGSYSVKFDLSSLSPAEKSNVSVAIMAISGASGSEKIRVTSVIATK